jgi:hypothetical protein
MADQQTNQSISLFKWMTYPLIGNINYFSRGPKPRIGGGFMPAADGKQYTFSPQLTNVNILEDFRDKNKLLANPFATTNTDLKVDQLQLKNQGAK